MDPALPVGERPTTRPFDISPESYRRMGRRGLALAAILVLLLGAVALAILRWSVDAAHSSLLQAQDVAAFGQFQAAFNRKLIAARGYLVDKDDRALHDLVVARTEALSGARPHRTARPAGRPREPARRPYRGRGPSESGFGRGRASAGGRIRRGDLEGFRRDPPATRSRPRRHEALPGGTREIAQAVGRPDTPQGSAFIRRSDRNRDLRVRVDPHFLGAALPPFRRGVRRGAGRAAAHGSGRRRTC